MLRRLLTTLVAVSLMTAAPAGAQPQNKMGYRLLTPQEAAALPRGGGILGMEVERAQQLTDSGMTFEILRVKRVRPGLPGEQVGFQTGDEIIAVDGRVFPTVAAFAAYIGSIAPGNTARFDIIPAGRGPDKAQRISVVLGAPGQAAPPQNEATRKGGLSTGAKVAIGVGAAALFGCYKLGCFKRKGTAGPIIPRPQPSPARVPGTNFNQPQYRQQ